MWGKGAHDQAAGLRRLLANVSLQRAAFFSAIPAEMSNTILLNIGAALVRAGADVQLLDARRASNGLAALASDGPLRGLWQQADNRQRVENSLYEYSAGLRIARLSDKPLRNVLHTSLDTSRLSQIIKDAAHSASYWMIDAGVDHDQASLLPDVGQAELVIVTSNAPESIKSAYGSIKTLSTDLGRKVFHLLVVNTSEAQADLILQNISAAAERYLNVQIKGLGSVPPDEKLWRAEQMGRLVIELFPTAEVSAALRAVASKLLNTETHHPTPPPSLSMQGL